MEQAGSVIAIVSAVFGGVITLLLYIWKLTQNANEKRHLQSEKLIGELIESKHTNDLILQELKMITKSHDEDIRELRAKK